VGLVIDKQEAGVSQYIRETPPALPTAKRQPTEKSEGGPLKRQPSPRKMRQVEMTKPQVAATNK